MVWFSIVEEDRALDRTELLVCQSIPVPDALTGPEQLRFVRQTISDVIDDYGVTRAGIRLAEPVAKKVNIHRLHIEGVLQELLASSPVESYFYGAIAQIGRLLGVAERTEVKELVGGESFRGIDGWSDFNPEERESILVAVAALALEVR